MTGDGQVRSFAPMRLLHAADLGIFLSRSKFANLSPHHLTWYGAGVQATEEGARRGQGQG